MSGTIQYFWGTTHAENADYDIGNPANYGPSRLNTGETSYDYLVDYDMFDLSPPAGNTLAFTADAYIIVYYIICLLIIF